MIANYILIALAAYGAGTLGRQLFDKIAEKYL